MEKELIKFKELSKKIKYKKIGYTFWLENEDENKNFKELGFQQISQDEYAYGEYTVKLLLKDYFNSSTYGFKLRLINSDFIKIEKEKSEIIEYIKNIRTKFKNDNLLVKLENTIKNEYNFGEDYMLNYNFVEIYKTLKSISKYLYNLYFVDYSNFLNKYGKIHTSDSINKLYMEVAILPLDNLKEKEFLDFILKNEQ